MPTRADQNTPTFFKRTDGCRGAPSKFRSSCRRSFESPQEACGKKSKNPVKRNASQRCAASSLEIRICSPRYRFQLPRSHVLGELFVPVIIDKLLEPFGKAGKLLGRKIPDGIFKVHCAHGGSMAEESDRSNLLSLVTCRQELHFGEGFGAAAENRTAQRRTARLPPEIDSPLRSGGD